MVSQVVIHFLTDECIWLSFTFGVRRHGGVCAGGETLGGPKSEGGGDRGGTEVRSLSPPVSLPLAGFSLSFPCPYLPVSTPFYFAPSLSNAMDTTTNTPHLLAASQTNSPTFQAQASAFYARRTTIRSIRPSSKMRAGESGIGRGRSYLEDVRLSLRRFVNTSPSHSCHFFLYSSCVPSFRPSSHSSLLFDFQSCMLMTTSCLGSCINAMMCVFQPVASFDVKMSSF